jgi:hypothetical protein
MNEYTSRLKKSIYGDSEAFNYDFYRLRSVLYLQEVAML